MSRTVTQAQKRNAMTDHFPDWPNCTLASSINQMGPPETHRNYVHKNIGQA